MEEKENIYYVYLHRRASDNKVFYVGKGKGKRAFQTGGRNDRWNKTYKKHGRIVEIVFDGLSQQDAFDIEIDTITEMRYHYGETLCNMTNGGEGALGAKRSEETKRLIGELSKKRSGKLAERNADKEIYKFLKLDDLSVIESTRLGLCKDYNINHFSLRTLFLKSEPKKTACGFSLLRENETVDDCLIRIKTAPRRKYKVKSAPRYNCVYCFVAADGTAFWATIDEFESRVGHKVDGLLLYPDKVKVSFGWAVINDCSYEEAVSKARRDHLVDRKTDHTTYTFINNESNVIFTGTRAELASEFNLPNKSRLTELFCKRKRKSVYGWSLHEGE